MTQVFHSDVNNIVPWQANYTFPSQATKADKSMVKIPAKTGGGSYGANQVIRFEFPSDQYLNPLNSEIAIDISVADVKPPSFNANLNVAFAAGVFTYTLTGLTGTTLTFFGTLDAAKGYTLEILSEGAKGATFVVEGNTVAAGGSTTVTFRGAGPIVNAGNYSSILRSGLRLQDAGVHAMFRRARVTYGGMVLEDIDDYNVLARKLIDAGVGRPYLHGSGAILEGTSATYLEDQKLAGASSPGLIVSGSAMGTDHLSLGNSSQTKRMCFRPFLGLMQCKKLIPLKWMASALTIELTLASSTDYMFCPVASSSPVVTVSNPIFLAELLNFDSAYDAGLYYGMKTMGVPLKFSSWRSHEFNLTGTSNTIQIHERARSIKMALAAIHTSEKNVRYDTGRAFQGGSQVFGLDANGVPTILGDDGNAATPSSAGPVEEYQWRVGGRYYPAQPVDCRFGGAEAYVELLKCMDALGDYTFAANVDPRDWHVDYSGSGGNKFMMVGKFENSDVSPDTISGINGEEQSDIMLQVNATKMSSGKKLNVFIAYDALLIVKPENSVELIM